MTSQRILNVVLQLNGYIIGTVLIGVFIIAWLNYQSYRISIHPVHCTSNGIYLGRVDSKSTHELEVIIINNTNKQVMINGANDGCTIEGCVRTNGLPITIDGGNIEKITFVFIVPDVTGPFKFTHQLYSDVGFDNDLSVVIEGNVVGR